MDACCRTLKQQLQFWTFMWMFSSMVVQLQVQAQLAFPFSESEPRTQSMGGPICASGDIRNNVDNFQKLKDCEVIEGNLQILLIDKAEPSDYENLQFPKLREITGFLVLFRVSNLQTLSHIFPNLAVIRGDTLFHNYALVVYEMLELQEIGLPSLVNITRGGVRIEKNPNLCYLDMVDWSLILHEGVDANFIVDNKDQEDCLNFCPEDLQGSRTCRRHGATQELCWTAEHCQKVCPVHCEAACYKDSTTCCHEQCIGGCDGPTPSDCTACRNLVVNNTCTDECPAGTYKFFERRCILPQDCPANWILFNGVCDQNCPIGFTQNTTNPKECQPCNGPCPKVCDGGEINSVSAAAYFKGCTKLEGSLSISIHGASESNIMKELEESLGILEEITGSLVVRKAASLVSLNFLKRLRVIRGDRLQNDKYAVYVMDNRNLQHLFHWETHPNITIGRGKLFFHFNPKLCMSEIRRLNEYIGGNATFGHGDINPSTNGDQVACSTDRLVVKMKAFPSIVLLGWSTENVELGDQRNLLGFIIQWKETLEENVMEFDGEDVCGASTWESQFADPPKPDEFDLPQRAYIGGLRPYTLYAFLVRSYTISDTNYGAKSDIMYIRTSEEVPSAPVSLSVYSNSPNNLMLEWSPPENPNGIITHYIAKWQRQALDKEQFSSRDFCREKPPTLKKSGRVEDQDQKEEENNETLTSIPGCCGCPKDPEELLREQEEARFQREFENVLHNAVYQKRPDTRRRRRDVPEGDDNIEGAAPGKSGSGNNTIITVPVGNSTLPPPTTTTPESIKIPVYEMRVNVTKPGEDMFIKLKDLDHFEEYRLEVIACNNKGCGDKKSVIFGRTVPKPEADQIKNLNISTERTPDTTNHNVILTWSEPPNPNGVVIIYEIEYAKIDDSSLAKDETTTSPVTESDDTIDNAITQVEKIECINIHEYKRYNGYELVNIGPGNYTARIRAITLAGSGPQTETRIFQVPDIRVDPTPTPHSKMGQIGAIIGACATIIAVLCVCLFFLVRWQYRKDHMPDGVLYASVNPEYMSTNDMYVADEWEFPRNHLDIIHELGKGSFGMVYEGLAKGILPEENITTVAIKSVQQNASIRDRIEFLNEASVMKSINAHHVVRLLGVVSKGQPTYVIMEFMSQGDLKNWLRARRPENQPELPASERKPPPTLDQIINMAAEIADGMAFLASHKYIHRDLSARNCLVSEEGTCKVADFGLARDIYQSDYYRKERGGMLPIRWMAPESVKDGVFQCSSDVWSYGILLWEISTLGELPYQGYSNEEAGEYIKSGRILPNREGTPENLHELMLQCWQYNDKMRPTFFDILNTLENSGMINPNFATVSFYHDEARIPPDHHEHMRPTELEHVSIFNEEEEDEDDRDEMDKSSEASGRSGSDRCGTPTKKDTRMNGYVSMPVNGKANGTANVGKVTEC